MDERAVRNWSYNEGKALISAYKNRKDEYDKCRNKDSFWQNILTDLESMNVLVSMDLLLLYYFKKLFVFALINQKTAPTTIKQVQSKWKTLCRAYKAAKDRGTGSAPSKFLYLNEMDELFHDNPLIEKCIHVVSVGINSKPVPASTLLEDEIIIDDENYDSEIEVSKIKRRKREEKPKCTENLIEIKKKYYEECILEKREKRKMIQKYLEEKENRKDQRHQQMLEILKERNA